MPQELIARRFRTCSQKRIAPAHRYRQPLRVAEQIIDRDEIVALLFNVPDIVAILSRIERLLFEDDDGQEEADEG